MYMQKLSLSICKNPLPHKRGFLVKIGGNSRYVLAVVSAYFDSTTMIRIYKSRER